jgi:hypothetical protein
MKARGISERGLEVGALAGRQLLRLEALDRHARMLEHGVVLSDTSG